MTATDSRSHSLWSLGGLSWREVARRVWIASDSDDIYNRAYELAYNFLMAIFPLLLFLMALFGMFAGQGIKLRYDLFRYLHEIIPPLAYDLLQRTVSEVIERSGGGKLTFGLLFALYAGSTGTTQLMYILNIVYQVRETRSWIKIRLISLALTLLIAMLILAALFLVLAGGYLLEFLRHEFVLSLIVVQAGKIVQWIVAIIFVVTTYAMVFNVGPDRKGHPWHWISPGSVIGVAIWLAASGVLRLYLHFITSYSKSYGSLGAVIILLLWFHVTGLAFLIGAEFNSVIEHASAQ